MLFLSRNLLVNYESIWHFVEDNSLLREKLGHFVVEQKLPTVVFVQKECNQCVKEHDLP